MVGGHGSAVAPCRDSDSYLGSRYAGDAEVQVMSDGKALLITAIVVLIVCIVFMLLANTNAQITRLLALSALSVSTFNAIKGFR